MLTRRSHTSSLTTQGFTLDHLAKKYGLRQLVEQNIWELVLNTAAYRKESLAVEIFGRFIQERYDADDLLFFLWVVLGESRGLVQHQYRRPDD